MSRSPAPTPLSFTEQLEQSAILLLVMVLVFPLMIAAAFWLRFETPIWSAFL